MSLRAIPAPLWFAAALVPMGVSQIVRLEQSDPAPWIFWDYAGRLGALAVLGTIPSARTVAFKWERLRMALGEAAFWIVGIVLFDHYVCGWIRRTIFEIAVTFVPFSALWALAWAAVHFGYWELSFLLGIPAAGFLVRP